MGLSVFSENLQDTESKGSEVGLHLLYNTVASPYSNYMKYGTVQYFQHAHFIPKLGVGKRGEYYFVHGDLPRQYSFGTTLRFTGPVPANSRQ